jgi:hypothetical protein
VHESAEVGESLSLFGQAKAACDVPRVGGDRGGMASRIPISRVQRGHECARERQMRLLLAQDCPRKLLGRRALLSVKQKQLLGGERGKEEQRDAPR